MKRLYDLDPAEVSLVSKGANKRKFLIFKSQNGDEVPTDTKSLLEQIKKADPKVLAEVEEVTKNYYQMAANPQGGDPMQMGLSDRAQAALKAVARILLPFKQELTLDVIDQVLESVGIFAEADLMGDDPMSPDNGDDGYYDDQGQEGSGDFEDPNDDSEGEVFAKGGPGSGRTSGGGSGRNSPENRTSRRQASLGQSNLRQVASAQHGQSVRSGQQRSRVNSNQSDLARRVQSTRTSSRRGMIKSDMYAMKEAINKSADGKPEGTKKPQEATMPEAVKQPVVKSDGTIDFSQVPEAVRPALELIYKSNQELATANKELVQKNADLKKQQDEDRAAVREKEIVQKSAEFSHLGIPAADIVDQLKLADKAGKEMFDKVCKNFEALSNQSKESAMFKELGTTQNNGRGGDAYALIEKAAEAWVQKSGEKLTKEQAFTEFIEKSSEGQKMYAEYKKQRGGI